MITKSDLAAVNAALDADPPIEPRVFCCAWCSRYFTRVDTVCTIVAAPTDPEQLRHMSHGICAECFERVLAEHKNPKAVRE